MVDNPFSNGGLTPPILAPLDPPQEETKPIIEPPLVVDEEAFERDDETNLQIMQRVLAKYNNIESDIPVNHNEYWAAKRRL